MAITATDLLVKLSVTTGSAGNSTAQADPNASLGKYVSTTEMNDNSLHNLFDVVTGDENVALDVEYRCVFVHNNHATLTWIGPKLWISTQSSVVAYAIGLDPAGNVAKGSASAQAATIANEGAAPAGVSFTAPTTKAGGLSIGDLTAGQVRGIWIRRTAANSAAVDNDPVVLSYEGDTAA